ncbi:MAG TPA: hypothetical protein DDY39_02890 [Nitrospira sp.]|nr:hypothetical protein [Nitrospira sp.]
MTRPTRESNRQMIRNQSYFDAIERPQRALSHFLNHHQNPTMEGMHNAGHSGKPVAKKQRTSWLVKKESDR